MGRGGEREGVISTRSRRLTDVPSDKHNLSEHGENTPRKAYARKGTHTATATRSLNLGLTEPDSVLRTIPSGKGRVLIHTRRAKKLEGR